MARCITEEPLHDRQVAAAGCIDRRVADILREELLLSSEKAPSEKAPHDWRGRVPTEPSTLRVEQPNS